MKKGIIGALIALCGSAVAIGTAFALYTGNLPAEKTIQIGTKTTGDVQLEASVKNAHSEQVINPNSVERCIEFYAGFTTPSESTYIQDYYYAKLEFKVSSESTKLIGFLKEETWVEPGTQEGENSYSDFWKGKSLNKDNVHEDDDHKSLTYTMEYPLFKGTNISEFKFHIRLKSTPKLTNAEFLEIAEESYKVDFQVSPAESTQAYIVGEAVGGWELRDEFRMTKNAKADHDEWMFKTGKGDEPQKLQDGKDYKLRIGDTFCHSGSNHVWETKNDGKTFYWNGTSGEHGDLFN